MINRLPHTFDALLARFGRLTEIQQKALEPLLAGRNCVLVAATASGKTEAALAPMLERDKRRMLGESQRRRAIEARSLRFLYLVPTRALARDIGRRVEHPMAKLAVSFAVKTSDEAALRRDRPPEFLITTPESLDSLLANRPRSLKNVRTVVLDELHLYDYTPRGDQLRILLNRLRRVRRYAFERGDAADAEIQFCALSATMHEPVRVAARYFADPVLIHVAGGRAIDAELVPIETPDALLQFLNNRGRERGGKKILAFCARRAECEEWAYQLRGRTPFGEAVWAHHASLSGSVRRALEQRFAEASAALCFATSTLELGIDIGDVDLILLLDAPDNYSSFLQRIGRGNRRTARTAVSCFYRTRTERAVFEIFLRAARAATENDLRLAEELLRPDTGLEFCPSVVVQQLCSYLKQTRDGELDTEHAYQLFTTPHGEPLLEREQYEQIVEHLVSTNFFTPGRSRKLHPGAKWQELYERRTLYGNLSADWRAHITVIDDMTGRRVGSVESAAPMGETFLLGGMARRVVRRQGWKLSTRALSDECAQPRAPRYRQRWSRLSPALALALAAELAVPYPADSSAPLSLIIESASDEAKLNEEPRALLCHCAGEVYAAVLGELLEGTNRVRVLAHNDFYLELSGDVPETLRFTMPEILSVLNRHWRRFESAYDFGCFQSSLPHAVRRAGVVAAFDASRFHSLFAERRLASVLA
ncbi:MAG: DEAD/DEAH box helicase [Pyrinomonadaceae bacterium MAG19_C2-C3]|nr:DEAD/DEAH box helicase [Pyrinomonadaceae bacterium MAG19_C2-C3]